MGFAVFKDCVKRVDVGLSEAQCRHLFDSLARDGRVDIGALLKCLTVDKVKENLARK